MPLILDAWNVLHVRGVLPPELAGLGLDGLQDLLAVSRYRRRKTTIVCDGTPPKRSAAARPRLVSVRYSGTRATADEVIIDMVRRSTAKKRITVVTSDREIIREVRRCKSRTIQSEKFLQQLVEDRERDRAGDPAGPRRVGKLHRSEVEEWTDEFGIDESIVEETPEVPTELLDLARGAPDSKSGSAKKRRAKSAPSAPPPPDERPPLPRDVIDEAKRLLDEDEADD
jgi:predicted RNA-binding protein with PIN domain